ncbi:hypothetical protein F5879DRAFT_814335, partial [Lentinula edodes]
MLIDAIDSGLREAFNKELEDHAANPVHGIHSNDFHTFTRAIQVLDNGRHCQLLMARQMAEHMIQSRPTSRANTPLTSSSVANAQGRRGGGTGSTTNTGRLPPLTTNERHLLSENEGCFKCRSFFVKCCTSSTEHEFPLPIGNGYKELTVADVTAACKLCGMNPDLNKKPRTAAIASIGVTDDGDDDDVVASIMPSAVLGDGTDSKEEVSCPFRVHHLRWKCHVSGPKSVFPVRVNSLIDNGAHLTLIHPDLACRLGLPRHQLPNPEPVSAAFQSGAGQSLVAPLTEYVLLKVDSIDCSFTSRTVPFIVAPNLCTQLLLGLPWLSHNHIVIDHAS